MTTEKASGPWTEEEFKILNEAIEKVGNAKNVT